MLVRLGTPGTGSTALMRTSAEQAMEVAVSVQEWSASTREEVTIADLVPQATQGTGVLADTSARATCPTEDATRLPPVWNRLVWSGASAHLVMEDSGLVQQDAHLDRHLHFPGL